MPYDDPGRLSIITGSQGTGKTDWACSLMERTMKKHPEIIIISNIKMMKPVKGYVWVNSLKKLLKALCENERSLLIIDESGIHGTSGYGSSYNDNGEWVKFIKQQRKFGVSTIWIDQTEDGSIPPQLRKMAVYKFHKWRKGSIEKGMFFVDIFGKDDKGEWEAVESGLIVNWESRSDLPYDTKDNASFKMDLPGKMNIKDVFDHLSNFNSSVVREKLKELLQEIETKLDNDGAENKENCIVGRESYTMGEVMKFIFDSITPKPGNREDLNKALKEKDIKNKDISKILGVTEQYVYRIKNEWIEEMKKESGPT